MSGDTGSRDSRRGREGTLLSVFRETVLTASFVFTLAANGDSGYQFTPGSSAFVSFPSVSALKRRRSVYVASSPDMLPRIEAVASAELIAGEDRLEVGARWLDELLILKTGSKLLFYPERKDAACEVVPDSSRLVFLADGAGMASVFSILRHLSIQDEKTRNDDRILVLWRAENRDNLPQARQIEKTLQLLPRTAVVPCLLHDPLWTKEKGELDKEKLTRLIPAFFGASADGFVWESVSYRISGGKEFTKKTRALLRELGVPGTLIRCG